MSKVKLLCVGPAECGKTVICNFLADATEVSGGDYRPTQGVRILEFEVNGLTLPGRSSVDVELWDCSGDNKFEACWPAITQDAMGVIFVYNPDQPNHDQQLEKWYRNVLAMTRLKQKRFICFAHHTPSSTERIKSYGQTGKVKQRGRGDGHRPHNAGPREVKSLTLHSPMTRRLWDYLYHLLMFKFFGSQQSVKVNGCIVFAHHRPNAPDTVRTELPAGFSKMPRVETNIEEDPETVRSSFSRFLQMIVSALSQHREKEELNIMNQ